MEIRNLYLDPVDAGVPWLLDPEHPVVRRVARESIDRTEKDAVDVDAVLADLDDVLPVLRERHFGIATGIAADNELDGWMEGWRRRLELERPGTWGDIFGSDLHQLRYLVGDNHLRSFRCEDHELIARVDPRAHDLVLDDDEGPAVEERIVDGVQCVRIRTLGARSVEDREVLRDWGSRHREHFSGDRIVVDLRGNRGGDDTWVVDWMADYIPADTEVSPPERRWMLDGKPLFAWNYLVECENRGDPEAADIRELAPRPHPGARLEIAEVPRPMPAGSRPWRGRMLVLVDRRTMSAGEGAAWSLRRTFGAKLAGGPTDGGKEYGSMVPYLFAHSEMLLYLPTVHFDFGGIELTGIPADVDLDVRTPLDEIARHFDEFYPPR